jgi:IMP dehydrogenase
MTYDVVSVDVHGTVKDVIEKIQKTHHDGFPVVDGDEVVGYISARDLLFVQLTTC